ncbi:MAG: hypothetical protein MPK09_09350, partial [Gammaproteobacteria bacterium]|nr:hypothetical protein [Gammaproteobacteria bacterium]
MNDVINSSAAAGGCVPSETQGGTGRIPDSHQRQSAGHARLRMRGARANQKRKRQCEKFPRSARGENCADRGEFHRISSVGFAVSAALLMI